LRGLGDGEAHALRVSEVPAWILILDYMGVAKPENSFGHGSSLIFTKKSEESFGPFRVNQKVSDLNIQHFSPFPISEIVLFIPGST
jgi:hypothetical protein